MGHAAAIRTGDGPAIRGVWNHHLYPPEQESFLAGSGMAVFEASALLRFVERAVFKLPEID
jgi:hypothetical protein